jgi:hypothetical protein
MKCCFVGCKKKATHVFEKTGDSFCADHARRNVLVFGASAHKHFKKVKK